MNFFRAGGFDQARIESGRDLLAIAALDQKLWVALACPTKGLNIDARTLELIDTDKDGRIRAPELIAAVTWAGALLKDPEAFVRAEATLRVDEIADATLVAAAKTVLEGLGKANATELSIDDSSQAVKAFNDMPFNGDGVITADCAKDDAAKQLIADVIATLGGDTDRSGKLGVSAEKVAAFFTEVDAYVASHQGTDDFSALLPLRSKIDDFFARVRLVAFDPRVAPAMNAEQADFVDAAKRELTATAAEIRALPLARVEAGRPLPLTQGYNPGWEAEMSRFATLVGKPTLTEGEWETLKRRAAEWEASQRGGAVASLGMERLKALASGAARTSLDAMFAEDKARAPVADSIASLERLARYKRDLFRLANNFVSFKDFYERKVPAIFQAGTLFLDQRACELVIRVDDAPKHATMAPLSRAYLAYCDCVRAATGEKLAIAAAFTAGDSDNLMVGRNGVFYDREGKDWDATITKLVDNPISVRQAFFGPYKKALRFIEEQVAKRAAEEDKKGHAVLTDGATAGAAAASGTPPANAPPKKLDVGVVAALGVAVGGLTAALGAMLQAFFGLGFWMPLGVVALLLAISGPSMLIAWLKLRQRNIGPLLDANGWAVNANALLNVPLGRSLTSLAQLPKGAKLDTRDPFEEARRPWKLYIALVIALSLAAAWGLGKLDHWLPERVKKSTVFGEDAPVTPPPT